jgi:hypothetical protein
MRNQIDFTCDRHPDLSNCPDSLVARWGVGDFVLRIHDGGSSGIGINHCPWCGALLA